MENQEMTSQRLMETIATVGQQPEGQKDFAGLGAAQDAHREWFDRIRREERLRIAALQAGGQ